MALTRDLLINIVTKGIENAAGGMKELSGSIGEIEQSTEKLAQKETLTDRLRKRSMVERLRDQKAYQQANVLLGGQLDVLTQKAEGFHSRLFNIRNLTFGALGSSLAYVGYQLKQVDRAGQGVNVSLDTMQIKLASAVKKSKGLGDFQQAVRASKEYVDFARNFAATTPFEQTEVIGAMSNLAPVFKGDLGKIKKALEAASVLATVDPMQGFQGAVYAIREAASGSTYSLASRFELSKSQLNKHIGPGKDLGTGLLKALSENGYTAEMVNRIAQTLEGMQSNILDSTNFVAGNFNRPIFDARKMALFQRMTAVQRDYAAGGGRDLGMQALGQGVGTGMTLGSLGMQTLARPMAAAREGFGAAMGPGAVRARAYLETAAATAQVRDLESRYATLTDAEHDNLKQLRRRLREIPVEASRAEREAKLSLSKTGSYVAKVLGLDAKDTQLLQKTLEDISRGFVRMVEKTRTFLTSRGFTEGLERLQRGGQALMRALVMGPIRIYNHLKESGFFTTMSEAAGHISDAFTAITTTLFGERMDRVSASGDKLGKGGVDFAKAIATGVNLLATPIRVFNWLAETLKKTIGWVAERVSGIVGAVGGVIERGLRLTGRKEEADAYRDEIAKTRKELEGYSVVPGSVGGGGGGGAGGTPAAAATATGPAKRASGSTAGREGASEGASTGTKVAAGVVAGLGALGIIGAATRVKEVFNAGRGSSTGFLGAIKGLTNLGVQSTTIGLGRRVTPLMNLLDEVRTNPAGRMAGIRTGAGAFLRGTAMSGINNVLTGRGVGGLAAGAALTAVNPLAGLSYFIYGGINSASTSFFGKVGAGFRMIGLGFKTVAGTASRTLSGTGGVTGIMNTLKTRFSGVVTSGKGLVERGRQALDFAKGGFGLAGRSGALGVIGRAIPATFGFLSRFAAPIAALGILGTTSKAGATGQAPDFRSRKGLWDNLSSGMRGWTIGSLGGGLLAGAAAGAAGGTVVAPVVGTIIGGLLGAGAAIAAPHFAARLKRNADARVGKGSLDASGKPVATPAPMLSSVLTLLPGVLSSGVFLSMMGGFVGRLWQATKWLFGLGKKPEDATGGASAAGTEGAGASVKPRSRPPGATKTPTKPGEAPAAGLQTFLQAVSDQESGTSGGYAARNKRTGAMGKYQVMPQNLDGSWGGKKPRANFGWDFDALGRDVTPEEFMKSPEIQEKIARHRLGKYYEQYGSAGAARMWYANDAAPSSLRAGGGTEPSPNQYSAEIHQRMKAINASRPATSTQAGAVQAALAGNVAVSTGAVSVTLPPNATVTEIERLLAGAQAKQRGDVLTQIGEATK